jgi:hypothetical protein
MRSRISAEVIGVVAALFLSSQLAQAQFTQQGNKLVGSGASYWTFEGSAVALSGDGNTAIAGGPGYPATDVGVAWIFTRNNGYWSQQGDQLAGYDAVGSAMQGSSVALSADGNTAIVGGYGDNLDVGAAWVFARSNGFWIQQGGKLVGNDAVGAANQGASVALSADGNTAIVGGYGDNSNVGAAWVFTRSDGVWSQRGSKLVGNDAVGGALQGSSVALSADGNTAIMGALGDNSSVGATWVFTRSDGGWEQQGSKLVGNGAVGAANQGTSVALSADGNTAFVGGSVDNSYAGAAWVFARSDGAWSQQGSKLVGNDAVGVANQGISVTLSGDGNTAIVGGPADNGSIGAAWVFTRSNGVWSQQGSKLVGIGWITLGTGVGQGTSVALSGDGSTAIIGGPYDTRFAGAAWVFAEPPSKAIRTNTHDFNDDGYSDIVWRDTSGNTAIWLMNGTTLTNQDSSFVANVPSQWAIVGQRDFNGDGYADLLWRDTSGNVAIWETNGISILNQNSSFVANVPTNWSIAGTGDFNGGPADILWQDTSGNVAIWEMNGTTISNSSFVANVPSQWSIKGTGDFNGDGKTDILWQDTSGNVAIWEMNGAAILNQNSSFVASVPGQWSIVGTGDFNGDGMSDILWQDTSGNVAIWEMNGTTISNPSNSFVANVPGQWSIQLTGDHNGDGMSDILWQDTSGNVAIWEMNGTGISNANSSFVANVPGQWSIQHLAAE